MFRFVIFGGAGFIGRHLCKFLAEKHPGAEVHVVDLAIKNPDSLHHCVDIRSPINLDLPRGIPTVIYNLAAIHKTPGHPTQDYFETNMRGAENVCTFAEGIDAQTIVFTSSIAPYGASEDLKTEDFLPMPNTPYGISKLVAEQIHRTWQARALGRRLTILRPGIVFGQGEGGNYTRLAKALRKGFFAYAGRRDTLKAGIYVKDLVRVMDLMSQAQNCPFQLYNCCFPKAPTIEKIVETMMQVMGVRRFVPRIPARILKAGAKALGVLDSVGIGFHPERVTKLMISTNISGEKLQRDYPLQFDLKTALEDWWKDCGGKGLE